MNMQLPDQPEDTRELGDVIDDLHAELTVEREAREKAEADTIDWRKQYEQCYDDVYHWKQRAESAEKKLREAQEQEPYGYLCPESCGCIWRDNHDGTMSLFNSEQHSCNVCESLPLSKLTMLPKSNTATSETDRQWFDYTCPNCGIKLNFGSRHDCENKNGESCLRCNPFNLRPHAIPPADVVELQRENAKLTRKLADREAAFETRTVDFNNAYNANVAYAEQVRELRRKLADAFSPEDVKQLQDMARQEGIEEAKRQAVPEGWKLVPIEPTSAMIQVGRAQFYHTPKNHWKAMLAAVPQPEGVDK